MKNMVILQKIIQTMNTRDNANHASLFRYPTCAEGVVVWLVCQRRTNTLTVMWTYWLVPTKRRVRA